MYVEHTQNHQPKSIHNKGDYERMKMNAAKMRLEIPPEVDV